MALAREELVRVGEMFNTPDVISQAVSSLELALRDHTLLEVAGWPAARTEMLRQLVQDLQGRHATYAAKAGTKKATRAELLEELLRAKRWKGIAVAIGQNALDETAEEREKLFQHVKPVRSDAGRLLAQIRGLLDVANANTTAFRAAGATDAFLAEGNAIAADLEDAIGRKAITKRALPGDKDVLDELDGRVWYALKALHRSGRATHLAAGDRARANEYSFDLLYRRRPRRTGVTTPGATPPVPPA